MSAIESTRKVTSGKVERWKSPRPARLREWRAVRHIEVWPRVGGRADWPARFLAIEAEIAASRRLLDLPSDWDDEGAAPITQSTWEAAVAFLRKAAQVAYQRFGFQLPAPRIGPCRDGSLDLFWRDPRFTLLVNVPPKGAGDSDFYAKKDGIEVKGPVRPDQPDFEFLYWIAH